ncbi:MAG: hypothetical protein FRX49_00791 [Trebouxia sp. A1-2]|nr:MAG: hypothetical protein FRX49_00791 [Trebouxia sp. A1-2]
MKSNHTSTSVMQQVIKTVVNYKAEAEELIEQQAQPHMRFVTGQEQAQWRTRALLLESNLVGNALFILLRGLALGPTTVVPSRLVHKASLLWMGEEALPMEAAIPIRADPNSLVARAALSPEARQPVESGKGVPSIGRSRCDSPHQHHIAGTRQGLLQPLAGAREGDGENGVSSAWPHWQGRALPVVGGGAAGNRAAQAVDQLATAQYLEDVVGMPAPCIASSHTQ